jgi:hypothetical protein
MILVSFYRRNEAYLVARFRDDLIHNAKLN